MKYNDPLHVPYQDLVVMHKGKEVIMLNKTLLDQQNCWTNLGLILLLHSQRLHLEDEMAKAPKAQLKQLDNEYTQIEFALQEAWGFEQDARFHRFWHRPKCVCPQLDNEDNYPHGYYITRGDCPLHGKD